MKIFAPIILSLSTLLACQIASAQVEATSCKEVKFNAEAKPYANHYYLEGMMEVGSELLLKDDGRFEWYFVVGGLDQEAQGTWWKNGNCIGLKPEEKYSKYLEIFPKQLNIVENHLDVIWMQGEANGVYIRAEDLKAISVDED